MHAPMTYSDTQAFVEAVEPVKEFFRVEPSRIHSNVVVKQMSINNEIYVYICGTKKENNYKMRLTNVRLFV